MSRRGGTTGNIPTSTVSANSSSATTSSSSLTPSTSASSSAASSVAVSPSLQGTPSNLLQSSLPTLSSNHAFSLHPRASLLSLCSNQNNTHTASEGLVIDVWRDNLKEAFEKIMFLVDEFPYVAMDTEFPGIVARPVASGHASNSSSGITAGLNVGLASASSTSNSTHHSHYSTIKLNVDLLKLIQLGLTFCDGKGHILSPSSHSSSTSTSQSPSTPSTTSLACTFQFHFAFDLNNDIFAQDSIDLLMKSGIDFEQHYKRGIDPLEFAEYFMTSGVILNEDITWISFHSGYDFAYVLHVLLNQPLPNTESEFYELAALYFPKVFDVKYLIKVMQENPNSISTTNTTLPAPALLHGGLQRIADELKLQRIGGAAHQAGSDALLTAALFFFLRTHYFNQAHHHTEDNSNAAPLTLEDEKHVGYFYGLGSNPQWRHSKEKEKALLEEVDEIHHEPNM